MHRPAVATALSDEDLMQRVQADDDRAFELLYDRYQDRAWLLARALCRHGDRIERILQDSFTAAWRERAGYRPDHEAVNAWTMRLIHRRAGHPGGADPLPEPAGHPPASAVAVSAHASGFKGEPLRGLLGRLRDPQREIIALALYGHLTHTQIAELLALPAGIVKGRMRLGLHGLRDVIGAERAGDHPSQ
jgi:RNA polymerase sigma-70 factor (ECF subfamily)